MMVAPVHAAVLGYCLIGVALTLENGLYSAAALVLVLAALAITGLGLRHAAAGQPFDLRLPSRRFLAWAVILMAIASVVVRSPLSNAPGHWFTPAVSAFCVALILFALVPSPMRPALEPHRRMVFWLLVAAAFALRVLVVVASPEPHIDVFAVSQGSVAHLLSGLNPYTTHVANPFGADLWGYLETYVYTPATLYLQTAGFALGDVRLASVAAEAVVVWALWRRLRGPDFHRRADLLVILFLAHPRAYLIVEQAWSEPHLLMALGLMVVLYTTGRRLGAAMTFGFMLSLKQSMLFFSATWLLIERRPAYLAAGIATGLATFVPFAIWDLSSLLSQGVFFHFTTPYRPDGLTIFAPLWQWFGFEPTRWWNIGVGTIATTLTMRACWRMPPLRGFLWASSVSTLAMFALGNKAFANYYYLVGGLLIFTAAESLKGTLEARAQPVDGQAL